MFTKINKFIADKAQTVNNYLGYNSSSNLRKVAENFISAVFAFSFLPAANASSYGFLVKGSDSNATYIFGFDDSAISFKQGMEMLDNSNASIVGMVDVNDLSTKGMITDCFYQTPPSEGSIGEVLVRLAHYVDGLTDEKFVNDMCEQINALYNISPESTAIVLGIVGGLAAIGGAAFGYHYRNEIKNKFNLIFHKTKIDNVSKENDALLKSENNLELSAIPKYQAIN